MTTSEAVEDGRSTSRTLRWGAAAVRSLRADVLPRIVTLWLISVITFGAINALGVDVARKALGREATPAQLEAFRQIHGLNRGLATQYVTWLGDFVTGDWGVSALSGQPVRDTVVPRLVATLLLSVVSLVVALPASVGLGVFMAKRLGKPVDLGLSIGTVALAALPIFVIGILLIYGVSLKLGWTPVDSSGMAFGGFRDHVDAYVLPTATLALSLLPHFARMTRASVRETLTAPYAQAAVLRGLKRSTITWRHLMPNASGPIVNVVGLELMSMVGGVIVVENVFGFAGLGNLLVTSIQGGDLITVQAVAMVTAAMFIAISFVTDATVLILTPKAR